MYIPIRIYYIGTFRRLVIVDCLGVRFYNLLKLVMILYEKNVFILFFYYYYTYNNIIHTYIMCINVVTMLHRDAYITYIYNFTTVYLYTKREIYSVIVQFIR